MSPRRPSDCWMCRAMAAASRKPVWRWTTIWPGVCAPSARRLGVSAASLCHLAWAQVLSKVSGREDVVFGTVLFGRMQGGEGADRVMGLFINTLPVRISVGEEGVEASVRRTHALLADLLRHEHASLALAQRCSAVPAPAPLFSALLNYRHSPGAAQAPSAEPMQAWQGIGGCAERSAPTIRSRFRSTIWAKASRSMRRLRPRSGRCGSVSTCARRWSRWPRRWKQLPPRRCARSMCCRPPERIGCCTSGTTPRPSIPADKCVHQLFEEQVAKSPDATAVVFEEDALSYAELNRRANQLAHYLRELGVRPDDRVAICVERSLEMIVGSAGRAQGRRSLCASGSGLSRSSGCASCWKTPHRSHCLPRAICRDCFPASSDALPVLDLDR